MTKRNLILLLIVAGAFFALGAKTTEIVDVWTRNFSKITVTRDSDKVKIQFLEKDPNDPTKDVQRCGQTISSNQAQNLSEDLVEASLAADPNR